MFTIAVLLFPTNATVLSTKLISVPIKITDFIIQVLIGKIHGLVEIYVQLVGLILFNGAGFFYLHKQTIMERILATLIFLIAGFITSAQSIERRIDSLVSAYAAQAEFNGSILVSYKGQMIIAKGFGYMDADQKNRNNENTIFNIASITKTFTAALIMKHERDHMYDRG